MTDSSSGAPAPGWYTDPADPRSERWWGGIEWTEHTRAKEAAVAPGSAPSFPPPTGPAFGGEQPAIPAIPQFASQQPAIPQFASQQTEQPAIPQFASQQPAIPQFSSQQAALPQFPSQQPALPAFNPQVSALAPDPVTSGGVFTGALGNATPQAAWDPSANSFAAAPTSTSIATFGANSNYALGAEPSNAWNSAAAYSSTAAPRNPQALAGLLLSIFGVTLLGIIFSILGLRRASEFEQMGEPPVGRLAARWGLGLGLVAVAAAIAAYALFGPIIIGTITGLVAGQTTIDTGGVDDPEGLVPDGLGTVDTLGDSATARALEADIAGDSDFFFGVDATSVSCPATVSDEPDGHSVECTIVLVDGRTATAITTYSADGVSTEYRE